MDVRNPRYNMHGTIDCDMLHAEFGWIPFTASPDDPGTGGALHAELLNGEYGVIAAYVPVPETADALCTRIDTAADAARSAVVGDPVRSLEYQKAAEEARAFVAAGYPADAVPRTVAAYVTAERTAQQSADSILAEEAAYNEALYFLRETRLQAKEQVRKAMTDGMVEQAQAITDETVAAIQAAVAGVGNAGA